MRVRGKTVSGSQPSHRVAAAIAPVALSLALLGAVARPATAREPVHTLTLAEAVQLALANSPDSKSADEDVHAAEGALTQSHAFDNPSLFVSSLGRELSPFDSPVLNQFGVTWTVPIGGKRGAGIAQARADLDGARATRVASRRQIQLAVVTAFITVLLDQAQLDFGQKDADGLHQAERINELRYKDGKISYGDVLKLRIQVRGADDAVRQDELTLADDRADLIRLVGDGVVAPDVQLTGTLAPPTVTETLSPTELYQRALQNRTDYRAAQAGERSAGASVSQAKRQPIPDLDVLFDYNREPDTSGSYDVQLAVSIPLFDRNQGATRQAEAGYRKAHLATEALRLEIRADALKAVKGLETARARLAVYDKDLLAAARESLDITRHAYEQGRGTLLDYLDAEASYREVERAYRAAVADAMLAAAQVRFVAGEDLP